MEVAEKTIGSTPIFDGKVIKVRVDDVMLPNGKTAKRELISHGGGVGLLAVKPDGQVLMVEQFRIAAKANMLEIPAGKLEFGEDPLECGKRELIEETGYKAGKIEFLGAYYATPGYCEEVLHLYLATDLEFVGQHLDPDEFLNVKSYSLDELYGMVMENKIYDAKTAIAILKAKAILG